jgi:hypothetical protein
MATLIAKRAKVIKFEQPFRDSFYNMNTTSTCENLPSNQDKMENTGIYHTLAVSIDDRLG